MNIQELQVWEVMLYVAAQWHNFAAAIRYQQNHTPIHHQTSALVQSDRTESDGASIEFTVREVYCTSHILRYHTCECVLVSFQLLLFLSE